MRIATVQEIWRYPVKSMGGERLEQADVGALGLAGDRSWAIRDEARGGICGAKKIPALMTCHARYVGEPGAAPSPAPEMTLPDGTRLRVDDPAAASRLSTVLGRTVTLWPRRPAADLAHYRRGTPDHADPLDELRAIFGREADEPLPDLTIFPPELFELESPPGTYFDAFPILLLTDMSLRRIQALAPESRIDVRRFRPNFVLAVDGESTDGLPEAAWTGRHLRIGDAALEIVAPCPRCVMVTHGFDDLPKDPRVLRTIVREAGQNLGAYARVSQPGMVRVGDDAAFTTS